MLVGVVALAVAAGVAAATSRPLALKARVIERGEFRGFTPGKRLSLNSAKAYLKVSGLTPSENKAWSARLTKEGFKTDLTEFLNGAGGQAGVSGVMQLRSASSARAELAAEFHFRKAQGGTGFQVNTIPGAVGYDITGPSSDGENVLFADGPFLYVVGYGWYGPAHNPKRRALLDAVAKLYTRVHGHPAS